MSKVSNEKYIELVTSGEINSMKAKILYYIIRNPEHTIADIKFHSTGMAESTITARVSDLLDAGLIKIDGEFVSKFSKYSKLIYVRDLKEQLELSNERKKQKAQKYIKALLKLSDGLSNELLEALNNEF